MSETCIQASDICEIFPRFQVYFIRHRSHTCWFLYEVLLPTLQSADLPASGAGNTTPQRAGTCYAKCMFLALRTLLDFSFWRRWWQIWTAFNDFQMQMPS